MTDSIKLRCKCGATFEQTCSTYLSRGERDEKGRLYQAERRADDWLEMHKACLAPTYSGVPVPVYPPPAPWQPPYVVTSGGAA